MRPRAISHAFGAAFLLIAAAASAQKTNGEVISALRDKAVVLDIVARVVERQETEVWNAESSKVTIPGRPVAIKLVGANVVVLVQFTPYKSDDGRQMLVAQGQVWVDTKEGGLQYQTTMQTIPIDFGEKVYYFPLGSHKGKNDARIEIQIELKRYAGDGQSGEAKAPGKAPGSGDAKQAPQAGEPQKADDAKPKPAVPGESKKPSAPALEERPTE